MFKNISTATIHKPIVFTKNRLVQLLLLIFCISWTYMFLNCRDTIDWFIENILVFIGMIYLILSYKWIQFSSLSYLFLFLFLFLHIYGAQYAYTLNPVGEWMQNRYHLQRNPYDRIVHFSFGFLLAYPIREVLIKKANVKGRWQYLLPIEITLSFACIFELIEWLVAEFTDKETGETYVATQGDVWDAHKDIAVAVIGAAIIMLAVYIIKERKNIRSSK